MNEKKKNTCGVQGLKLIGTSLVNKNFYIHFCYKMFVENS